MSTQISSAPHSSQCEGGKKNAALLIEDLAMSSDSDDDLDTSTETVFDGALNSSRRSNIKRRNSSKGISESVMLNLSNTTIDEPLSNSTPMKSSLHHSNSNASTESHEDGQATVERDISMKEYDRGILGESCSTSHLILSVEKQPCCDPQIEPEFSAAIVTKILPSQPEHVTSDKECSQSDGEDIATCSSLMERIVQNPKLNLSCSTTEDETDHNNSTVIECFNTSEAINTDVKQSKVDIDEVEQPVHTDVNQKRHKSSSANKFILNTTPEKTTVTSTSKYSLRKRRSSVNAYENFATPLKQHPTKRSIRESTKKKSLKLAETSSEESISSNATKNITPIQSSPTNSVTIDSPGKNDNSLSATDESESIKIKQIFEILSKTAESVPGDTIPFSSTMLPLTFASAEPVAVEEFKKAQDISSQATDDSLDISACSERDDSSSSLFDSNNGVKLDTIVNRENSTVPVACFLPSVVQPRRSSRRVISDLAEKFRAKMWKRNDTSKEISSRNKITKLNKNSLPVTSDLAMDNCNELHIEIEPTPILTATNAKDQLADTLENSQPMEDSDCISPTQTNVTVTEKLRDEKETSLTFIKLVPKGNHAELSTVQDNPELPPVQIEPEILPSSQIKPETLPLKFPIKKVEECSSSKESLTTNSKSLYMEACKSVTETKDYLHIPASSTTSNANITQLANKIKTGIKVGHSLSGKINSFDPTCRVSRRRRTIAFKATCSGTESNDIPQPKRIIKEPIALHVSSVNIENLQEHISIKPKSNSDKIDEENAYRTVPPNHTEEINSNKNIHDEKLNLISEKSIEISLSTENQSIAISANDDILNDSIVSDSEEELQIDINEQSECSTLLLKNDGSENKIPDEDTRELPKITIPNTTSINKELFGGEISSSEDEITGFPETSKQSNKYLSQDSVNPPILSGHQEKASSEPKRSILDDITTILPKKFTKDSESNSRSELPKKKFMTESMMRELERRRTKPKQPSQSIKVSTFRAKSLPAFVSRRRIPTAASIARKIKQSQYPGKSTKQQVLKKQPLLRKTSKPLPLTPAYVRTESESSGEEMIVRRTPGKKSSKIESDSESAMCERNSKILQVNTSEVLAKCELNSKKMESNLEESASSARNLTGSENNKSKISKKPVIQFKDFQSVVTNVRSKVIPKKKTAILIESKLLQLPIRTAQAPSTPKHVEPLLSGNDSPSSKYNGFDVPSCSYTGLIEKEQNNEQQIKLPHDLPNSLESDTLSMSDQQTVTKEKLSQPCQSTKRDRIFSKDEGNTSKKIKSSKNTESSSEVGSLQINDNNCEQTDTVDIKTKANSESAESSLKSSLKRKINYTDSFSFKKLKSTDVSTAPESGIKSDKIECAPAAISKYFFGHDVLFESENASESTIDIVEKPTEIILEEAVISSPLSDENYLNYPTFNIPSLSAALEEKMLEAQSQYTEFVATFVSEGISKGNWRTAMDEIVNSIRNRIAENIGVTLLSHLLPVAKAFLFHITQVDAMESFPADGRLCPQLFKLFMAMKVIETNLGIDTEYPLEQLVMVSCQALVCSSGYTSSGVSSVTLSSNSLACLAAWHTASCCVLKNGRKPQWQWARSFLVNVLCHYPGTSHEALLVSIFQGRLILPRVVKYRKSTCIEKILIWIVHHGPWIGRRAIRKTVIEMMTKKHAIEVPPTEPLQLVQSILNELLHSINKKTNEGMDTPENNETTVQGLIVLSCWMGSTWLVKELLPFLVVFLSTKKVLPAERINSLITRIASELLNIYCVNLYKLVSLSYILA